MNYDGVDKSIGTAKLSDTMLLLIIAKVTAVLELLGLTGGIACC